MKDNRKNKIVFITPTKGRPFLYKRLKQSYIDNKSEEGNYSEILPIIDNTEIEEYGEFKYLSTKPDFELQQKLNYGALHRSVLNKYKYIGTFSDDVVVDTKGFDKTIIDFFEANPKVKIIFCNDLSHSSRTLATHWVMRQEVVKALGFFVLPTLRHMFVDNFITRIGNDTGTIHYFEDIIWEHRHFTNKKADMDDTYRLSNREEIMKADEIIYNTYINSPAYERDKELLLNC